VSPIVGLAGNMVAINSLYQNKGRAAKLMTALPILLIIQ
jgi:hypothetical protein